MQPKRGVPLPDRSNINNGGWSCRSLLDINCGPDLEQQLVGQKVFLHHVLSSSRVHVKYYY